MDNGNVLKVQESNMYSYDGIERTEVQQCTRESFNPTGRTSKRNYEIGKAESYYSSDIIQEVIQINHEDIVGPVTDNGNHGTHSQNRDSNTNREFLIERYLLENKNAYIEDISYHLLPIKFAESHITYPMSLFMSEEMIKYPLTSTPKKPTIPKDAIPRLNAEEISYMKGLADVIRDWMKTLPLQLDDTESLQYKEVIINDLAGNIVYQVKKYQLAPSDNIDDEIKLLIFLWLNRFRINDNPDNIDAAVDRLYPEILKVPIPSLTQPQHGTRKTMKAIQFLEEINDSNPLIEYIPKGIDIIEDEISMWMNEQPEKVYMYSDRTSRSNMVHKLAEILEQHLLNKHSQKEIEQDVAQWLYEVIKPNEKEYIDQMIEELRDRVKNLPQEATLRKEYKEKLEMMYLKKLAKEEAKDDDTSSFCNDYNDPNETMKEFIEQFIQHNYDVDDLLARNALSYILKKELVRINPPTRKEIYENFAKSEPNALFTRDRFLHELEYIKLISDWLQRIPITPPYNNIKNKHRIYFIHNLAKYITEIEEERTKAPDAMDYDLYLYSIIRAYIGNLPISTQEVQHIIEINDLIVDLINNIKDYKYYIQNKRTSIAANPNNIGEFINEFINEHGKDIKGDPLKFEVWTDRLMTEIQKLVRNTPDPNILGKTQLYKMLAEVPLPKEESIELFNKKLGYVKQITDWLKNLPLKNVLNQSDNDRMVNMISELSDKLTHRFMKKLHVSVDTQGDTELIEFLKQWITTLPLDSRQEIIVPVVIQQLMNRVDKVNKSQMQENEIKLPHVTEGINKTPEKCVKCPKVMKLYERNPENAIIEAVEKFCNALPIQANNEHTAKVLKDEIAKKLLQKISKLNIDPTIFNDELLFKEMFLDEVDMVLEIIPQDVKFQKNKEILKNTLINSVLELEDVIKKQSAGENYKQKLKNTIEASIPNPIQLNQAYDPGFEFYKNRLATMFILENFDHSDEDVKLKYERLIQSEVDKYFEYAENKNAIPLSKDRIQNDLYDALFKVPIPNEASVSGEVEEAKTRFEIDAWYELLPVIPTHDLDELLERDKILSALAKRIHEIEKVEKNADPFIHKEIIRWLTKLPLLPRNEQNIEEFANRLQNRLKSTFLDRKCVSKDNYVEKDRSKGKANPKADRIEKSQLNVNDAVNEVRQPPVHNQIISQRPAADLILEVVEGWCSHLPVQTHTPADIVNSRNIKDNLAIKIVLKISELNSDPEIFNDDNEYDAMLDQEIDKLMYNLPILCDYQDKEVRKFKLKEQIRSIKPIILIERDKHEYKKELEQTVGSFLEESNSTEDIAPPKELIEKIVDDFIQYNYNKDDIEERSVHKSKVHETVVKNLSYMNDKLGKELALDPLMIRNELICKLSKVPAPSKLALHDIITEIRMKKEVEDLFQKLSLHTQEGLEIDTVKVMKVNLTKKLCELEKNGHDPTNDGRMRDEISKGLRRLNKDIDLAVIDAFVDQLRNNEVIRKTPPRAKLCRHDHHRNVPRAQNQPPPPPPPPPATNILNQCPLQLIPSLLPKADDAPIARQGMVIPPRYISSTQIQDPIEVFEDNRSCKCAGRTRKRKRVCMGGRHFLHNYYFRRPGVPMWCRYPRLGFCFY